MSEPTFYLYQVLWWVFVTLVAFAAALLFWKKGKYEVKGKTLELGLGLKLTGAGGIFVAVLLVFYLINPIKPLKKVFIVYSNEKVSELLSDEPYVLKPSSINLSDSEFDPDNLAIEMIHHDYAFDLLPCGTKDKSFRTPEIIPQGPYQVRVFFLDTGESKDFYLDVPDNIK